MAGTDGWRKQVGIADTSGNTAAVLLVSGIWRVATDAVMSFSGDIQIGAVELDDALTETRASIKPDGGTISASGQDGGLMVAGRDSSGIQHHLRTDLSGNLVTVAVVASGAPGQTTLLAQITSGQFGPNTDIFASGAANAPRNGVLTVGFGATEAEIVSLLVLRGGVSRTASLNAAGSIGSGQWAAFDFPAVSGDGYNLQLSASGTVMTSLSFRDV